MADVTQLSQYALNKLADLESCIKGGWSYKHIAREWNRKKIHNLRGKRWTEKDIRSLWYRGKRAGIVSGTVKKQVKRKYKKRTKTNPPTDNVSIEIISRLAKDLDAENLGKVIKALVAAQ